MFVTANQFGVFVACFSLGSICGILFSVSALFKFVIKNRAINWIFDVLAFVVTGFIFVVLSHRLLFPDYRIYMSVGVFVGVIAYLKSFHILLAKCTKKIYNILRKKLEKVRHDRIKSKKADSGCNGGRSTSYRDAFNDYGLSTDIGECGEETDR